MDYNYDKRGYLLPHGCKELSDAWKRKEALEWMDRLAWTKPSRLPPLLGEVYIPEHTTVLQLASILGQKVFRIMADLREVGVVADAIQELDFDTIARVARKHGYAAKKANS